MSCAPGEVGEATQQKLTEKLFQRDYRGQTPVSQKVKLCAKWLSRLVVALIYCRDRDP